MILLLWSCKKTLVESVTLKWRSFNSWTTSFWNLCSVSESWSTLASMWFKPSGLGASILGVVFSAKGSCWLVLDGNNPLLEVGLEGCIDNAVGADVVWLSTCNRQDGYGSLTYTLWIIWNTERSILLYKINILVQITEFCEKTLTKVQRLFLVSENYFAQLTWFLTFCMK